MAMTAGELVVKLGVKSDITKVKDFVKSISDLPLTVASNILALAGMEYGLWNIAQSTLNASLQYQKFTAITGRSSQELQKWGRIAEQAGVSTDVVSSAVKTVQENQFNLRYGRGGKTTPYYMLGIDPRLDAEKMLYKLRDAIKGKDRVEAMGWLRDIGLQEDMIMLLQLSDKEFNRMASSSKNLTEEQIKIFDKSRQSIAEMGQEFKRFVTDYLLVGAEGVTKFAKGIDDLSDSIKRLTSNKEDLGSLFTKGIGAYMKGIGTITGLYNPFSSNTATSLFSHLRPILSEKLNSSSNNNVTVYIYGNQGNSFSNAEETKMTFREIFNSLNNSERNSNNMGNQ